MIDLHTHSVFSDGELIPAELIRRASFLGYTAIAITDHVDYTNIEHVMSCMKGLSSFEDEYDMEIIKGVELTHVPPAKMQKLVGKARKLGAELIVVHGETITEPVLQGTNRAALSLDIDILAHPGLITLEDAVLAKENGICLEITCRCGHNRTNGHVAKIARETGAGLVVNTDAHAPRDLVNDDTAFMIAVGAGLDEKEAKKATGAQPLNVINSLK